MMTMNDTNVLSYLEIQITDSCNLNCKGCSHLAGLFCADQHIPLEHFRRDLERMRILFPVIEKIRLLGGEPFLIPNMEDYCKAVRSVYPDADIRIVTNGLLCLKRSKELYAVLHELHIGIDVSMYPPTVQIQNKLTSFFDSEGVSYKLTEPINRFVKRIDPSGSSDIHSTFWQCDSKWCSFLRDGLLCICPAPFFLKKLAQQYKFSVQVESGIINIHETSLTSAQIKEFLNSPNEVCRYCTEMELFDWKANQQPKLTDWIIEKGREDNGTESSLRKYV